MGDRHRYASLFHHFALSTVFCLFPFLQLYLESKKVGWPASCDSIEMLAPRVSYCELENVITFFVT